MREREREREKERERETLRYIHINRSPKQQLSGVITEHRW